MATKGEKLLAKGQGLERKGKLEKALDVYRDGCRHAPYDPDLWTARAEAAQALGLSGEAAEALFHVSDLFARSGMPLEALKLARRVLELDKGHGGARRFVRMLESRADDTHADGSAAAATTPVSGDPPVVVGATVPAAATMPVPGLPSTVEIEPPFAHAQAMGPAAHSIEPFAHGTDPPPFQSEPEPFRAAPAREHPSRVGRATVLAVVPPIPASADNGAGVTPRAAVSPPADRDAPLIDVARRAPSQATVPMHEFGMGSVTIDTALESLTLGDRLPAAHPDARTSEIPLDDGPQVDVLQAVASTITTSPLLSELDSDLVRLLIECGSLVHRAAGSPVFRQGEIGTSLFLVLSGEVSVERDEEGGARELARLRAGAFFGEMALLTNMPRSATVRAVKNVDLLEISRRDVRDMIDRDPRVLRLLMRFFRARLVGTLLQTSPLFRPFSREGRRALVSRFRLRELTHDFPAIREGFVSEGLFVILVGRMLVTRGGASERNNDGGGETVLAQLGPGDVFGEMSLLDEAPAVATVRTQARSWVLLLGRDDFVPVLEQHPEIRDHLQTLAAERREQNRARLTAERPAQDEHLEPV